MGWEPKDVVSGITTIKTAQGQATLRLEIDTVIASILVVMVTLCNRADHYIFALWFLSSFFLSSPNLSGQRLDVYHTSKHMVWLSANLECMSEMCCTRLAENTGLKK